MARTYQLWFGRRLFNVAMRAALRLGLATGRYALLTVPGRRTGVPHSTPVIVHRQDGARWLVSPYGERAWTKNARHAGRVTLSRGNSREIVTLEEAPPDVAAPVLRQYMQETPLTRPFFDVSLQSSLEAFEREAPKHPVFRIIEEG
jgi:deazaflavin-dependent oxidoreductase (nitroreductase family)